jgi:NADH-quinone oxidoreductase subunit N
MFVTGKMVALEKEIITFATLLIFLQANSWLKTLENCVEFCILLLSVLMGMFFMLSSGNFLMFFLGLEMATIPLAALAAFDHGRIRSSEGAGKMILSSAFSSSILLFGLSLLYGTTGSLGFNEIREAFNGNVLQIFSLAFIFVGFAFKISLVPFHLWTADVYEGSPVAVTSFLSVVSKAASVFIFMTVLDKVFPIAYQTWVPLLVILSAVTMTVGNLFAIRQTNIKRFLAFSSITQAGYILIGVAAASAQSAASVLYFILIYVFSNIGAFTVVALISQHAGKEDIDDYKGLYRTNPKLSIAMLLAVFSLAGIPPTAGFFGKLFLLTSGASAGLIALIIIASLNMIISLYYYLKIAKAIFVDKNEVPIEKFASDVPSKIVLIVCVAGIFVTGLLSFIFEYIYSISIGL